MPRIARLVVKGEKTVYHVMSRTALAGYVLEDVEKDFLLRHIRWLGRVYFAEVLGFCIMGNHAHLPLKIPKGLLISCFIAAVHRGFSFEINQWEGKRERSLWKNYWDRCVRDELDYWQHFNYIHNNPVKHGMVGDVGSLKGYRYSSYWNYVRTRGVDWLMGAMADYLIIDFTVENDE